MILSNLLKTRFSDHTPAYSVASHAFRIESTFLNLATLVFHPPFPMGHSILMSQPSLSCSLCCFSFLGLLSLPLECVTFLSAQGFCTCCNYRLTKGPLHITLISSIVHTHNKLSILQTSIQILLSQERLP